MKVNHKELINEPMCNDIGSFTILVLELRELICNDLNVFYV